MLRSDGFFEQQAGERSAASEIAESVLLKCQRESEERKLRYMGQLLANIVFDRSVSRETGHQLLQTADTLTYRQLTIISFWGRLQDSEDEKLRKLREATVLANLYRTDSPGILDQTLWSFTCDIHDLNTRAIVTKGHTVGQALNFQYSATSFELSPFGARLRALMGLSAVPVEDMQEITQIFLGEYEMSPS